ncbi:MAG: sigma-54 dependent transcriptional regulator [Victivallaceae bacterium]
MKIKSILVVDDEPLIRDFLETLLKKYGYAVQTVSQYKDVKKLISKKKFDLVITDMNLEDGSGLDVIRAVRARSSHISILVITAFATIENAVAAVKHGAFNYITKPFSPETLLTFIKKAEEHASFHQNDDINTEIGSNDYPFVSESPKMQNVLITAKQAALSNANIFIHGESGSGKEVISKFIHEASPRSMHPYIKINCAAIPETLLESEFFGHEKGAFTGALNKKPGRFELADKGTLLLDEITEVPVPLQAKLLRAIQEKEFEHLGGTKTISVDIRILATSNRNLQQALQEKIFREDLYYRLNVISLSIPPLRERKEDILPLAEHFLKDFRQSHEKSLKRLSRSAVEKLCKYSWPGNIRELSNVIERSVILSSTDIISAEDLLI